MASGGNSIAQWKLMLTLKNYLTKYVPKSTDDVLQKDLPRLLNLSTNKNIPKKDFVPEKSTGVLKVPAKVEEENAVISNLNSYLPLALNFNKKVSTEVKKPAWMERRKNIVPKVNVDSRTRYLLHNLGSLSGELLLKRVEDICSHLKQYPNTKGVAIEFSGVPKILKLCDIVENPVVKERSREALALLGYVAPVRGRGIRILSIDGGGIRGLVAINILKDIEKRAGQPIHRLFDYICGVSTGGVVAALIGAKFLPLDECETLYNYIGNKIFSNTTIQKTARLVWNSSAYNGEEWSKLLEENIGDQSLIETAQKENMPKMSIIASHSGSEVIKPFVFRNYNLPHRVASQFEGSISAKIWEAVRASAAAPGYFSEFTVGDKLLLDGGVMVNNPTGIGLHEALLLWPDTKIQTVVSVGTGRHVPLDSTADQDVSWTARLRAVINSATDTEVVHATMHDLLPFGTYFRFNPYLSETITLDETRQDKISLMLEDAKMYIRKNDEKFNNAVVSLTGSKDIVSSACDYYNRQKLLWKAKL